jgi:DNA polymerase-3 subunit epsilon
MSAERVLSAERSYASVDLETTGTAASDRIVEIAVVRVDGGMRRHYSWLLDPEIDIPEEASRVHGITNADVAWCPPFAEVAEEVAAALRGCDLVGYNLKSFDIPMLRAAFDRAGVAWPCDDARVVDVFLIYKALTRFSLSGAVRRYLGREHDGAHRAMGDALATLAVLDAQLAAHPELPLDIEGLAGAGAPRREADWATECGRLRWENEELVVSFSKHRGKKLSMMDDGFLQWILKGDFPQDMKDLVEAQRRGDSPRPAAAAGEVVQKSGVE